MQQFVFEFGQIEATRVDLREAGKKGELLLYFYIYFGCFAGVWGVGWKIGRCFPLMTPVKQISLACP